MPKPPAKKSAKTGGKAPSPPFPDPRAMEAMLAQLGDGPGDSAVDAAQQVMYDAWEIDDRRRRIALAKKALALSPFCADAYVLLAQETARSLEEEIEIYRLGVEAGEKALGKACFREDVGHFWGLLETRPYMRARHGLALGLWDKGEHDEAIAHFREMLRLNPNDNQGIRYLLLDCLLELNRNEEAAALIEDYPDDGGSGWLWSRALLLFRQQGDGPGGTGAGRPGQPPRRPLPARHEEAAAPDLPLCRLGRPGRGGRLCPGGLAGLGLHAGRAGLAEALRQLRGDALARRPCYATLTPARSAPGGPPPRPGGGRR